MSTEGDILKVVPGLQSVAILGTNVKMLKDVGLINPKGMNHKAHIVKKPAKLAKPIIKGAVATMIGVGLIGPTAGMINKL